MTKKKAMLPGMTAAAAAKPAPLTKAVVQRFLDHLAATCHVQGAAGAAGASTSALYKRRRSDPGFAAAWRAAVEAGYDRLEEAMLAHALAAVGAAAGEGDAANEGAVVLELTDAGAAPVVAEGAPRRRGRGGVHTCAGLGEPVARMDIQVALLLLNRRAAMQAKGRERHARPRPSAEEVEKMLSGKLDRLSRRLGEPAA